MTEIWNRPPIDEHMGHPDPGFGAYLWPVDDRTYFSDVGALSHSSKELWIRNREAYRNAFMVAPDKRVRGESNDAMQIGTMAHTLALLGRDEFDATYCANAGQAKRKTKAWEALEAEAAGREIVTSAMYAQAERLGNATRAVYGDLIERATHVEQAVCWRDRAWSSIWRRGKIDLVTTDKHGRTLVIDLKTRPKGEAVQASFGRGLGDYGYHRQADDYLAAWRAVTGERGAQWAWIVVDDDDRHPRARLYSPSPSMLDTAARENAEILRRFAEWLANSAPPMPRSSAEISLPAWHRFQIEG